MEIELLESFKTCHAGIDTDHEQMIDIINSVSDATIKRELGQCKKLLLSFMDFARDHFTREEKILFDSGFPGAESHALYHQELLGRADGVRQLCVEMAGFLIEDVVKGDSQFVSHLIEKGLVKS